MSRSKRKHCIVNIVSELPTGFIKYLVSQLVDIVNIIHRIIILGYRHTILIIIL